MVTRQSVDAVAEARRTAAAVVDPELPFVTIEDLGVLRDVRIDEHGAVEVQITPTYSGCPALETIASDVRESLYGMGFEQVSVRTVLSPAWSTDWITDAGREKLRAAGIAPPAAAPTITGDRPGPVSVGLTVRCPQCGSPRTREISRYGSTACKAIWACAGCLETFEAVKPL